MKTDKKMKDTMKITQTAFMAVVNFIGSRPAESGGACFGYEKDNIIRFFVPDANAKTTRSSYSMNTPFLNSEIKKKWENEKMSLLGIWHAHPKGHPNLSPPDKSYFEDLLTYMPREKFYTPIMFTIPDGGLEIFPYVYEKGSTTPKAVKLEIVSDNYLEPKKVQPITNLQQEVSNNFVLVVLPKNEKSSPHSIEAVVTNNILIVALSVALIFNTLFLIIIGVFPIFFLSFIKIITLWN